METQAQMEARVLPVAACLPAPPHRWPLRTKARLLSFGPEALHWAAPRPVGLGLCAWIHSTARSQQGRQNSSHFRSKLSTPFSVRVLKLLDIRLADAQSGL